MTSPETSELSPKRRALAVAALYLATMAAVSSNALVHVALPSIAADLNLTASSATWVVNAYQVGIVASLIPMAVGAEVFGMRPVYLVGLSILAISALMAAFTSNFLVLCTLRVLQGVGAAAVMALSGAVLRRVYPPEALGRGISYNAMVIAVVGALCPAIGGVLLTLGDWPLLFFLMSPIALVALALGMKAAPNDQTPGARLKLIDVGLNALTFGLLFLALSNAGHLNLSLELLAQFGVGVGAGWWMWRRARVAERPFLPIDLLRSERLRISYVSSFCCFMGQGLALVSLPFFIHAWLGYGPLETGALMSIWPVSIVIAAFASGRFLERIRARLLSALGLGLFSLGLALIIATMWDTGAVITGGALALCGVGFGLFQTPNNRTMLSAAPSDRIAPAAGMVAQVRLVGQGVGAALAGALFAQFGAQSPAPFIVASVIAAVAAILSLRQAIMIGPSVPRA